ncbi:hypothetical protein [Bradyrhizobium japonicum]|uniref:hypothetical protein n=1 Tax=Bradyrhizobium japonicum TaxID=375 RepID=UPI00200FFEAF|nr:hypothetical protein [Bradyrhizobium japonicum]UQE03427.1 hypothetical protein JEY30_46450 [Bradyrhizobium japonicum]
MSHHLNGAALPLSARQTCIAACRDKIARKILRVAHRHIEIFKKPPGELFGEERGLPQAQQPSIPPVKSRWPSTSSN